jgi:hypothetical protein
MFKKTKTYDHLKDINTFETGENYCPLVGDPCYRFSRKVKETFFQHLGCSFLYIIAMPHLIKNFPENQVIIETMSILAFDTLDFHDVILRRM